MAAKESNGINFREIAAKYQVPVSSLHYRYAKTVEHEKKVAVGSKDRSRRTAGREIALSKEEELVLVILLVKYAGRGCPMEVYDLLEAVAHLVAAIQEGQRARLL